MREGSHVRWGRMGEQNEGERGDVSRRYGMRCQSTAPRRFDILSCSEYGTDNSIFPHSVQSVVSFRLMNGAHARPLGTSTYLSNAFSICTSNRSSQPTSTNTLTPPSSSSKDCEAEEEDCAPSRGVKLNMAAVEPRAPQAMCSEPVSLPTQRHCMEGKEKQSGEHRGMMNEEMDKAEYAKSEESRYPAFIEHGVPYSCGG